MDRLEQELSRIPLHEAYAPTHGPNTRPLPASARPTDRRETVTAPAENEPGSGSRFRLDTGYHQTQSRWLTRPGQRSRCPSALLPPRCTIVVANPAARILAAMVNWLTVLEREFVVPAPAEPGDGADNCLATIAGRTPADATGLVRLTPLAPTSGRDYLLVHRAEATDDPIPPLASRSGAVETYSLAPGLDWWAGDLRGVRGYYRFRAYQHGEFCTEIRLGVPGSDQVLPALAAVALGVRMRLTPGEIKERLEDFSGIPRKFESRGSFRGATLVDDEAVGVGAVGDVLRLAREVFGHRTLRAIYLPHEATAASADSPEAAEFAEANHLILVDSAPFRQESTRLLAAGLRSSGASVAFCASLDEAIRELDRFLEPGDVLITLGAGEVGTIADAFLRRLSRDRHG